MIYGLIFDNFPIYHRHDQPWLIIAGLVSLLGFIGLGVQAMSPTPQAALAFFWFALMGMGMADVIVDAMVVKKAKQAGQRGGANLQTYCWVMYFIGSLIGRPTSGSVAGKKGEGARSLMLYYYTGSVIILIISAFLLTEKPGHIKWSIKRFIRQIWKLITTVLFNFKVLLPIAWVLIRNAVVPDISAGYDYWKQQEVNISADTQQYIATVGDLLNIIGLLIYARFFKTTPFRKMFFVTQLIMACLLILDVIVINRWNTRAGIPDIAILIIVDSFYAMMEKVFFTLPVLVLAAQLCPNEMEAAFYATMTSLANSGGNTSRRFGGWLLDRFGVVIDTARGNVVFGPAGGVKDLYLKQLIWLRFGLAFLPLFLIWFMVPNVASINPYEDEEGEPQQKVLAAAGNGSSTSGSTTDADSVDDLEKKVVGDEEMGQQQQQQQQVGVATVEIVAEVPVTVVKG
ncbi:hypothetical protein HK102_000799 [Quaeritorhiza haematococci]|nr:hypothetical protein HK102_000799 [Quaeritorhiza haematococci]